MRQITAASRGRLASWLDDAVNTPHVRRFLSMSQHIEFDAGCRDDDWAHAVFLSDDDATLLKLAFTREEMSASISIWSLHQDRCRRAVSVGRMLRRVPDLARRYGVVRLTSGVHSTNEESLRLNRRRFGEPWGSQPGGAWDAGEGRFVDCICFQRAVDQDAASLPSLRHDVTPPALRLVPDVVRDADQMLQFELREFNLRESCRRGLEQSGIYHGLVRG